VDNILSTDSINFNFKEGNLLKS